MVTYGGRQWVLRAVEALVANTQAPFELIVVDNASTDGVQDVLRTIDGTNLIFNSRNVGFGPGANQGVLHARGRYVCVLNSDAFVEPGWLPPLVDVLETDALAGAVVPCLLHLDGALQEAGGVVGSDGSTRALGDGGDPGELEYRFRRYIDYGSAACLLMRRSVFLTVGGFDPAYPLGYCEDVDLCFSLREMGLRTVYEPRSRVVHVRWGSSSRVEAERRVFANQPILLARWRERLAGRPSFADPPFEAHDVLQARDADASDRILLVTDSARGCPGPPSPRTQQIAAAVPQLWPDARITMLLGTAEAEEPEAQALLTGGVEVAAAKDWEGWFEARRFHYSLVIVSGPACFERFEPLIAATQPQAAPVLDLERRLSAAAAHLEAWWPGFDRGLGGFMARRLSSLEAGAVAFADIVLCGGPEVMAFAAGVAPQTPACLVPGTAPAAGPGFGERRGVAFCGDLLAGVGFEEAAGGELLSPLRSILAELRRLDEDLGRSAGLRDGVAAVWRRTLLSMPSPQGFPDARVLLVPPPFVGGGLDDALRQGVPVVLWRGAADGLDLGPLEHLLIADDAQGLARRAVDLASDPALWDEVRAGLLRVAARRFGSSSLNDGLWSALAHCGIGAPGPIPGRLQNAGR